MNRCGNRLKVLVPAPNSLSHCLESIAADRRREVHIHPLILVHRFRRAERISQEGELHIRMCNRSIDVLAVNDPCLTRMQFESAFTETRAYSAQCQLGLRQALAVDHPVIGVAAEPYTGEIPGDPNIKGVVQEQVGQ